MTAIVRRILLIVALMLLFALGLAALARIVVIEAPETKDWVGPYAWGLEDLSTLSRYSLAALMIFVPLFVGALSARASRQEAEINARSRENDEINLTKGAVCRSLHHELMTIPGVVAIAPRVRNGAGGPRVVIHAILRAGVDVPAVQHEMKGLAALCLRRLFGVGDIESIRIVIAGLKFGADSPRPSRAQAAPRPASAPAAEDAKSKKNATAAPKTKDKEKAR